MNRHFPAGLNSNATTSLATLLSGTNNAIALAVEAGVRRRAISVLIRLLMMRGVMIIVVIEKCWRERDLMRNDEDGEGYF